MKKIAIFCISVLLTATFLVSCKNKSGETTKESTITSVNEIVLTKADSLYANVQKEWAIYTQLDSAKYKDLKGVYFQLKNVPSTDAKGLAKFEESSRTMEAKHLDLNMPNFVNEFFSYDSLLMIHVRDVIEFSENTKGAENLAGLKELKESLLAEIDDNKFVSIQSHLDLSIAIYNDYLKAHPEVMEKSKNHKLLPEFGTIDHSKLQPVL